MSSKKAILIFTYIFIGVATVLIYSEAHKIGAEPTYASSNAMIQQEIMR